MKEITNANEFQEIINQQKPILLDFYADWCGPCRTLLPIVEKLSSKHEENAIIVKINVDKNQALAQKFNVRSIPALFLIKDGEVKEKLVGLKSEGELDKLINQYASSQVN